MGEGRQDGLRLQLDARVRLEFNGSQLTSDAGLLACRELDEALDLTQSAADLLAEPRTGRNIQYDLVALLRQVEPETLLKSPVWGSIDSMTGREYVLRCHGQSYRVHQR